MKKSSLTLFLLLFLFSSPLYADIYKWTDAGGQVHYTDDPKKIPAEYQEKAQDFDKVEKKGSVTYDPSLDTPSPARGGGEPFWKRFLREEEERAKAPKQHRVILYMTDW